MYEVFGRDRRYLRWSLARATVELLITVAVLGIIGESLFWVEVRGLPFEAFMDR
jgi:hypothetical protein